jgi:two-component system nitrate/nitrite response regulator NarL
MERCGNRSICMEFDVLILSDIRFVREGLADVLGRDGTFQIVGVASDLEHACKLAQSSPPRVILIDTALPHGIRAVGALRECAREAEIVAFALAETETEVIAWAQAGIYGYIPRNASLSAVVGLLSNIIHGEQICPTRIAAGMLRWIARNSRSVFQGESSVVATGLTAREHEVAHLIGTGRSNKEIARQLGISVATTKSHVHNILGKLGVSKRAIAADRLRQPPDQLPQRTAADSHQLR